MVGTGPRGSDKQRIPLQANRLQASIGPYLILGQLHAKAGTDAVSSVMKRDPMMLTNATIAYEVAGSVVARDVGTIIVNRLLLDWVSPSTDSETLFPNVPIRSPFATQMQRNRGGA